MCPREEIEPEFLQVKYQTRKMYHPEHVGLCIDGVQCDRNEDGSFDVPVHLCGKAARLYDLTTEKPAEPESEPVGASAGEQKGGKGKGFFGRG